MKNILNKKVLDEIMQRIGAVTKDDKRLWGKMTVHEMFCHSADQIRLATGEKHSPFRGNNATRTILKKLILWGLPSPKGKIETTHELRQGGGGTKPTDFEDDKKTLVRLLNEFGNVFAEEKLVEHPAFGYMNKTEWGRLVYIHVNHHLKQFGR